MRLVRILGVFLTLVIVFTGFFSADAQSGGTAELSALKTDTFPSISAALDAYDSSGNFVSGLTPADLTLLEDNQPRPLDTLKDLQSGIQFVVALNPGPAFATRDEKGINRFDKISRALKNWAETLPSVATEDISLVMPGGANVTHKTATAFLEALSAYQPDSINLIPTLDSLSQALDLAAESASTPGIKSAVLFVTPLLDISSLPTLQNLSARAVELKVRVFIWIVASMDSFTASGATALEDLAKQTSGQYSLFSGEETLPSPETFLSPLRHTYGLTYTSAIITSGSHTVIVQLNAGGQIVSTPSLSFNLDIQPPNPILVSLPEQIVRQIPNPQKTDLSALQPTTQPIEIMVEFPDGHPRLLMHTTLYIDGQKIAENNSEPFNKFIWDLRGYTTSGVHHLQVEVLDQLGSGKISLSVPVTVTVLQPQRGLKVMLGRNAPWVVTGAVLLTGALLAVILVTGGRKRNLAKAGGTTSRHAAGRKAANDPLTQPVLPQVEKRNRPFPRKRQPPSAHTAYLIRLNTDGQPVSAPLIALTNEGLTFGNDPTKATFIVDDPSVSPLHARLKQGANGEFILTDESSTAGTWVNYELIQEPYHMHHGDVLHIGQASYRFMLHKPPERAKPHLVPEEHDPY